MVKRISTAAKRQGIEWQLLREGANHSVYSLGGVVIPVPRHAELGEHLVMGIFRECELMLGRGWWRA
jgi:hypothetical protein